MRGSGTWTSFTGATGRDRFISNTLYLYFYKMKSVISTYMFIHIYKINKCSDKSIEMKFLAHLGIYMIYDGPPGQQTDQPTGGHEGSWGSYT